MLWLAGLMGIAGLGVAGVGAAAFVGHKSGADSDRDPPRQEETPVIADIDTRLNQIKAQSVLGDARESAAMPPPEPRQTVLMPGDDPPTITADTSIPPDEADPEVTSSGIADQILLGDWIAQRTGPDTLDYKATSESLLLVWDDSENDTAEPQVDVATDPGDRQIMHVSMNGETVAIVQGDRDLDIADLTLIPLSSALAVGIEAV